MSQKFKNNSKEVFPKYILNLQVKDYNLIKNKIIDECYIDYYIFNRWKKGIQIIPFIYFEKINKIAGYELLKIN